MHVARIAAFGLVPLAALPAHAQSNAEPYRAAGTEPFWSLTIDGRTIRYQPAGGRPVTVAKPRPIIGFNGELYRTPRLNVDVTHMECSDGMSDRTWHDTVTVTLRGRTLRGCGGTILSERAVSAIDGDWRIESLYDTPVSNQTAPRVTFSNGRMRGNASCNNFSGSFRLERGRLIAGPLASTKKACGLRVQNVQEDTILGMFGERLSVSRNRGGKLVLSGPGNRRMVLAPRFGG